MVLTNILEVLLTFSKDPEGIFKDLLRICKDFPRILKDLTRILKVLTRILGDLTRILEDLTRILKDLTRNLKNPQGSLQGSLRILEDPGTESSGILARISTRVCSLCPLLHSSEKDAKYQNNH